MLTSLGGASTLYGGHGGNIINTLRLQFLDHICGRLQFSNFDTRKF